MITHYVTEKKRAKLVNDDERLVTELLWGDPVHLEADWGSDSTWAYVTARGQKGWVKKSYLKPKNSTNRGLLEFYVIDVGQGDGVLIRTPDDRWHLIDAGVPNHLQMTKKGATNFVRWKFYQDLKMRKIKLHSLTASHPDHDHYGGMLDLLGEKLYDGRTFRTEVDVFYHCGMGRFEGSNPLGALHSGQVAALPNSGYGISRNDSFITELLDNKGSFAAPPRPLKGDFARLAKLVGEKCAAAQRLSHLDQHLPGYGPGQSDVTVHVLGPILESIGQNGQGLRKLGSGSQWESKTRNGHSIVYRFDYGNARILMTGDLNDESQRLLMSYIDESEYAVDVAKGCHHGSKDINIGFVKAMKARATAISSGDNESYSHPQAVVLGASGKYGREARSDDGAEMPPMVYSTEVARSVELGYASKVRIDPDGSGPLPSKTYPTSKAEFTATGLRRYRSLRSTPVAVDLIYGLINIRTDGDLILCAVMKESGKTFDKHLFKAGVDV